MEKVEKVINVSRVILILNMEELYDPKKSALIIPVSQKWIQFGDTNLTYLVLYPTEHGRLVHRHFQPMKMTVPNEQVTHPAKGDCRL